MELFPFDSGTVGTRSEYSQNVSPWHETQQTQEEFLLPLFLQEIQIQIPAVERDLITLRISL